MFYIDLSNISKSSFNNKLDAAKNGDKKAASSLSLEIREVALTYFESKYNQEEPLLETPQVLASNVQAAFTKRLPKISKVENFLIKELLNSFFRFDAAKHFPHKIDSSIPVNKIEENLPKLSEVKSYILSLWFEAGLNISEIAFFIDSNESKVAGLFIESVFEITTGSTPKKISPTIINFVNGYNNLENKTVINPEPEDTELTIFEGYLEECRLFFENYFLNPQTFFAYVLVSNFSGIKGSLPERGAEIYQAKISRSDYIFKYSEKCREELFSIYLFLTEILSEENQTGNIKNHPFVIRNRMRLLKIAGGIAVLFLIYIISWFVDSFTTQVYKNDGVFNTGAFKYNNQPEDSPLFQEGAKALSSNNTKLAITRLEKYIKESEYYVETFYPHFLLGQAYLIESRSSFLGLFPFFFDEDLQKAIFHFSEAKRKNISGFYPGLNDDADFFLGLIYLIADNYSQAEYYFNSVIKNNGNYSTRAQEYLKLIKR